MNYRLFALALLTLATAAAEAAPGSVNADAFFRPGPTPPAELPADLVYPRGRLFPFSFFSVGGGSETKVNDLLPEPEVQKEFARYKALGFPIFGPQYELNDRALDDAKKLGLKVIYTVGLPMNFHDRSGEGKEDLDLTPEQIEAGIRQQVEAVAGNTDIAFWYLKPEELRPWRKAEMAYLEAASRAVRASDPLKRPLWIYDPNHAGAKRLAAIAPWVDYLGKGMYPNYASQKDSRVWCRWTIEQEIEAIKLAKSSAIPVAVPEMFRQPDDGDLEKIPAWVRHDVFLSLVTGARGVFVFSARIRPNFAAREAYYNAYAEIGRLLVGEPHLGQVFLFGEPREDILVEVIEGPAGVEFTYPSGGVKEAKHYPSVSSAGFAFGRDRFLFLVNSAPEPVTVMVGGLPYHAAKARNLLDGSAPFDIGEGEFEVEIPAFGTLAYRIERK